MRIVRTVLCVLLGAYMLVDGVHALISGDYITPPGAYSGTLGPWASILASIHIDPRAWFVKVAFVILGLSWLEHARHIAVRAVIVWATYVLAALTVWYVPFGTLVALMETVCAILLWRARTRGNVS